MFAAGSKGGISLICSKEDFLQLRKNFPAIQRRGYLRKMGSFKVRVFLGWLIGAEPCWGLWFRCPPQLVFDLCFYSLVNSLASCTCSPNISGCVLHPFAEASWRKASSAEFPVPSCTSTSTWTAMAWTYGMWSGCRTNSPFLSPSPPPSPCLFFSLTSLLIRFTMQSQESKWWDRGPWEENSTGTSFLGHSMDLYCSHPSTNPHCFIMPTALSPADCKTKATDLERRPKSKLQLLTYLCLPLGPVSWLSRCLFLRNALLWWQGLTQPGELLEAVQAPRRKMQHLNLLWKETRSWCKASGGGVTRAKQQAEEIILVAAAACWLDSRNTKN